MKIYLKALLVTLVFGGFFVFGFSQWRKNAEKSDSSARINQIDKMESDGVPSFKAKDYFGKDFDLKNLQGKVVIVNFWASWCGPCLEEVPSLISLVEALKGDLHLVAVSGDNSKEDIAAFLKAFPKMKSEQIHIIWDEDRKISKDYNVDRLPESFVADGKLKLVKKIIGSINWHTVDSEKYVKEVFEKGKSSN